MPVFVRKAKESESKKKLVCVQILPHNKSIQCISTSSFLSVTYQQSPRTPCIMSAGLGLRKTASGIDAVPRPPPNEAMCCGRLHSATRGCSEKRGSRYRDFSVGGKESSTNWIFC